MVQIASQHEHPHPSRDIVSDPTGGLLPWESEVRETTFSAKAGVPTTLALKTKSRELAPQVRERERILPPGAGGPHAAPYKMLRTQVTTRLDKLKADTLAIFSPLAAAGKTLTAINLAIAIAADPSRTAVLVDFDLRNPSVHRRFAFEPETGVEDCLKSNLPIQQALVSIAGYERLLLLPARARVEDSSELLAGSRTLELIAELRRLCVNPVLIFDLPPVLQTDDALLFSRYVQSGLMVVHEGRTRREELTRSIGLLHPLPLVGTVLNASREPFATAY